MRKSYCGAAIALFACLIPLSVKAQNIEGLTIFGDSLSDNGNAFRVTNQLPPSPPYFNGRFSNGPIWVENLSDSFTFTTSTLNFAFGGATSGTSNTVNPALPGITTQVNGFLQSSPRIDSNRLYILWGGANDYLGGGVTNPAIVINNLSTNLQALIAAGGTQFIVVSLPDLGKIPGGSTNPIQSAGLTQLSSAHNQGLQTTLQTLAQTNPNLSIIPLDIAALLNEVSANPARFGFTNVTQACLNLSASTLCANPNEYLFWDQLHPSAPAHKIISDFAISLLNAPQAIAPQTDLALALANRQTRDLNGRLLTLRSTVPNQKLGVFVNGDFSFGDQDATASTPGYDLDTKGVTVGADYRVTDNLALGLALSYASGKTELNRNLGEVSMDGVAVSAYSSYSQNRFYADALVSYGWNKVDVTRNLNVTGFRQATAETDSNQLSLRLSTGYNAGSNNLYIGPTVGIRYAKVNIDGYTERDGSLLNLKVDDQEADSLILNLGAQVAYSFKTNFGTVTPYVTANYEHEFANDGRDVAVELVSQPGIPIRTRTGDPDRDFVRLSAGVQTQFTNNLSIGINYETTVGKANTSDHAVQAQLRYQF
jgi:outer membrane lipase/esterase